MTLTCSVSPGSEHRLVVIRGGCVGTQRAARDHSVASSTHKRHASHTHTHSLLRPLHTYTRTHSHTLTLIHTAKKGILNRGVLIAEGENPSVPHTH